MDIANYYFQSENNCVIMAFDIIGGNDMTFYWGYLVLQLFTIALTVILAYYTVRAKNSKTQLSNIVLILFTLFFLVGYFLEHTTRSLDVMKAVIKIEYLGQCGIIFSHIWFIDTYCGNSYNKWLYRIEAFITSFVLLSVFNLEHNTFFYHSVSMIDYGRYAICKVEPAFLYWFFYLSNLVVFIRNEVHCYLKMKKSTGAEKKIVCYIMLAPLSPVFVSLFKWFGYSQGFDMLAFGMFGFTWCLSFAIIKYDYFNSVRSDMEVDELTGVSSRKYFVKRIHKILKEDTSGALFMIDLDNFKSVNDRFGHGIGDKVLASLGEAIREIVTDENLAARLGGDEFVIFLQHVDGTENLEHIAVQICDTFLRKQKAKHLPCDVCCSIGISMLKDGDESFEQLYENADKALYLAKNSGKNQCRFFD